MNIYVDNWGVTYLIKDKKVDIKGEIPFKVENTSDFESKFLSVANDLKLIIKKNKVKKINIVISEGVKFVKVIRTQNPIVLNKDTNLLIKNELFKIVPNSVEFDNYSINYLKTGKKTQQCFLVATTLKQIIEKVNEFAIEKNINLKLFTIPEVPMYNFLKELNGTNVVSLYDKSNRTLRMLVSNGEEIVYATQSVGISIGEIENEVRGLVDYVKFQTKSEIKTVTMIGAEYGDSEQKDIFFLLENI